MPQPWTLPSDLPPPEFLTAVQQLAPKLQGQYAAQLLWQRGIRDVEQLPGFLQAKAYQAHSPYEFGQEMELAIGRLKQARSNGEKVAIWGDFDADGVTSTSVLWDGLGEFFPQNTQLSYYIPNRFTESHGLSIVGLEKLKADGVKLIITCDTGSTNLTEIDQAQAWGMDVIVTDHHTLPESRPNVVAIVNPRFLEADHPFATLSGVAVAFKLVEALYEVLPDVATQPLSNLLDLVAIGLIADLVELKGDCRYLAQQGLTQLQQQTKPETMTRPGIAKLLQLCKRTGDRPTDVSFGIGPRINAVSRIQGDAHFCVELLTSQDVDRCHQLAQETELANARRKALQQDVYLQAAQKAKQLDLSTTYVLVLWDEQWHPGVLGLVASQLAQEFGRPAILLSVADGMARGSARSIRQIDLYQLVHAQAHLLHRFGGHPFAAGLSLTIDNLPIFADAVNQRLRQQMTDTDLRSDVVNADLAITVQELGLDLYRELRLLEPYGMGNPTPKLWVRDVWFERTWQRNIQDLKGQKLRYIKAEFELRDESVEKGFPGTWWGHYKEELPKDRCDVLVELNYNTFKDRCEVQLLAVRAAEDTISTSNLSSDWLLDWREAAPAKPSKQILQIQQPPSSWYELQVWFRRAIQEQQPLAIAFTESPLRSPQILWQEWLGIAKYLSRTGELVKRQKLQEKLGLSDLSLKVAFEALQTLGFKINATKTGFKLTYPPESQPSEAAFNQAMTQFTNAIREEQFRQNYFRQISFSTMQSIAQQTMLEMQS